ncbi:MAG: hypothetical protein IPN94_26520 [Sphingobacteriales bacterium]|nr:hypothetical protein [Sphingobacteriales bacterium]
MKTNAEATQIEHWTERTSLETMYCSKTCCCSSNIWCCKNAGGFVAFRVLVLDGSADYQIPFRDPLTTFG